MWNGPSDKIGEESKSVNGGKCDRRHGGRRLNRLGHRGRADKTRVHFRLRLE